MNEQEQDRQEGRLRAVLTAAYPSEEPTDALKRRVLEHTARREEKALRRARRRRRVGLGLALAGATALVILGIVAWPTLVAAQALQRMERAAEEAQTVHSVTWRINLDGSHIKLREMWCQRGQGRLETPGSVQLYSKGLLYTYVPEAKRVSEKPQRRNPFFDPTGLSISAIVRSVLLSGHPERIHLLDPTELNGRPVRRIAINTSIGSVTAGERIVLYADEQGDLPLRGDIQLSTRHGWLTEQIVEIAYNEPLPPRLFAARFPKDAAIVNDSMEDATKQEHWEQLSSRNIGHVQVDNLTITLHDLQVNTLGDVFLLSSGGAFVGPDVYYIIHKDGSKTAITRPDLIELADDQGTRYVRQFNFGGQPNVQRWTPLFPIARPWRPRRYTITFYRMQSPGQAVTWTAFIARPQSAIMPDYLPHTNPGSLYWEEDQILIDDANSRGDAFRNDGTKEDLENALKQYQEVIRLEDERARAVGSMAVHPEAWFGIYETQQRLGHREEAREALQIAQDQDVYHNMTQQIKDAWKQMDMAQ